MQDDGGVDGKQEGEKGAEISSTTSVDVDILETPDPEPVTGSGTHLGGVVSKARVKVKHNNTSEKVTVDVTNFRLWSREDRESHQPCLTLFQFDARSFQVERRLEIRDDIVTSLTHNSED
jgi:hypothetical protein